MMKKNRYVVALMGALAFGGTSLVFSKTVSDRNENQHPEISTTDGIPVVDRRSKSSPLRPTPVAENESFPVVEWAAQMALQIGSVQAEGLQGKYEATTVADAHHTQSDPMVHKVVLTGGPCGGKSTALSLIATRLSSLGFNVYLVPEAATLLWNGGARFKTWDLRKEIAFEGNKIKVQFALEDAFMNLARESGRPSVVVCDRGTMDSKAYVSRETWALILSEFGWSNVSLRDRRYDTVVHMMSTALGAVDFYQTTNNLTRTETVEEAQELDMRILHAWVGHPRLYIVDNSTDFAGKMLRVEQLVCRNIGVPMPAGDLKKYRVKKPNLSQLRDEFGKPVAVQEFQVEQTYLQPSKESHEGYAFVQKRSQHGVNSYLYSTKYKFDRDGESAVIQRQIGALEYAALIDQKDPARNILSKQVFCFQWRSQYFELNIYGPEENETIILKTDSVPGNVVDLPPFIEVIEEVTGDARYSAYHFSKRGNSVFSDLSSDLPPN